MTNMRWHTDRPAKRIPAILLGACALLPAVQTAVSVYWEWYTAVTYPAFKILLLLIPIGVWVKCKRSCPEISQLVGLKRTNLLAGLATGMIMSGVILASYYAVLRPMIDPGPMLDKVRSLGLMKHYWLMAAFISLGHSLFEEYYWRGFIVGELGIRMTGTWATCILGGLLFGIHHIFALTPLFNWPVVVLCVLGTMVAGAVWSRMRISGHSIWDCYVSHVLTDLSVMWIGYDVLLRAQ